MANLDPAPYNVQTIGPVWPLGMVYRQHFLPNTQYQVNDVVFWAGNVYKCIQPPTATAPEFPTDGSKWLLLDDTNTMGQSVRSIVARDATRQNYDLTDFDVQSFAGGAITTGGYVSDYRLQIR